jgi:hypothetical protein
MPVHRDRSRIHEARVAGLAISLSAAALILAVVYVVGGFANRVVVELVPAGGPLPGTTIQASPR